MNDSAFQQKIISMIDSLKATCAQKGLGNDGNEYKVIAQMFLYKFLNDQFVHQFCKYHKIARDDFKDTLAKTPNNDYEMFLMGIKTTRFAKEHLINTIISKQNEKKFAKTLDDTLTAIAKENEDILSIRTSGGAVQPVFEGISGFVMDGKDEFAKSIIDKMQDFDFADMFTQGYDFFASVFEYLVKDYNSDSGGKYAEYYTPHSISRVIASILVPDNTDLKSVTCYDPSAGTGTLLMCLAHQIGSDRCSVYSQDISQKSSTLLRLNLVLNDNIHSIDNVIQGDTIKSPKHTAATFDYIVSNPPFRLDFSDYSETLDKTRFWAGVPKIPPTKKEKMGIYQCFVQHLINKLNETGKGAIVLPTGFLSTSGIDEKIRKHIIDGKMLAGIITMPSNIFANTGTKVSIAFFDKQNTGDVVLIDASNLGTKESIDNKQRVLLSQDEENKIINAFHNKTDEDGFSIAVPYQKIIDNDYTLSPGRYIKIPEREDDGIPFEDKMADLTAKLDKQFTEGDKLKEEIKFQLSQVGVKFDA